MPISAQVIYVGHPEEKVRGMQKYMKQALRLVTKWWHRERLPKHFTPLGARLYGYARRSRAYMIRKARKKHHQQPLVFSGDLRRQMTQNIRITGTGKATRGKMQAPPYIYKYRGAGPQKHLEATRVTADEQKQMVRMIEKWVARGLNRPRRRRVKRIA